MPTKSCFTCAFRTLNPQQCPLIGYQYADDRNQVCPYWVDELPKCEICGRIDPGYVLFLNKDETAYIPVCSNCAKLSGTCGGCSKSFTCDFETNPSPLPKAVKKSIQQGNQIIVTTVKNDERVNETCAKNCECFDHETRTCCREYNCCEKYNGVF
jgi:hypothetical protein